MDHVTLLKFIANMHLRNPVKINHAIQSTNELRKQNNEIDNLDEHIPKLKHEEAVRLSLSQTKNVMNNLIDLDYKLLHNTTATPFIVSDFPIVLYNEFLEKRKWPGGRNGYGSIGLQIFIPIGNDLMIIFYDKSIYKLGTKKSQVLSLNNTNDIDQLNILQFTNCLGNIFFSNKASKAYIEKLSLSSKKYRRSNEIFSKSYTERNKENSKLIRISSTGNETNLNLSFSKIHKNGIKKKLSNKATQLRPWPNYLMGLKNQSTTKYKIPFS